MRRRRHLPLLAFVAALAVVAIGFAAGTASSEDPALSPEEVARRETIERLGKELRKAATSPRAPEKKDDIKKGIDALSALGGPLAAKSAIEALALDDEDVEKAVMTLVETAHDKSLVAPLAALIDHHDYRRRFRLHGLLAHALGVMADVSAIEPLTSMIGSEDSTVTAATADALATYRSAPHAKRVDAVRRLIDQFETTWNLMMSVRPEDRLGRDRAKKDWEIFGNQLKKALQALTGQAQLNRPREFRDWWNEHKKDTNW